MELTVDVDEDVYETIEQRARTNDFESPEEYCSVVIYEVIEELVDESDDSDAVEDRLEDLGYLS